MHEFALAMRLVHVAEAVARDAGAVEVTALHVEVGRLSGVVPEALASGFGLAAAGTSLAAARLVLEPVEVRALCPQCGVEVTLTDWPRLRCPRCGTSTPEIRAGRELRIRRIAYGDAATASGNT